MAREELRVLGVLPELRQNTQRFEADVSLGVVELGDEGLEGPRVAELAESVKRCDADLSLGVVELGDEGLDSRAMRSDERIAVISSAAARSRRSGVSVTSHQRRMKPSRSSSLRSARVACSKPRPRR